MEFIELIEVNSRRIAMTDENKEFVMYHAARVIAGWPEEIEAAQEMKTFLIGDTEYPRVRYGDEQEDWNADEVQCHDCAVIKGQYHVPGCDVEECPACGWQAISCECVDEEDEEDDEQEE
jgi:hypothetical protein